MSFLQKIDRYSLMFIIENDWAHCCACFTFTAPYAQMVASAVMSSGYRFDNVLLPAPV